MFFGDDLNELILTALVGLAAGGLILAVAYPWLFGSKQSDRVRALSSNGNDGQTRKTSRKLEEAKDGRRKQLQEKLNQIGEEEGQKKKKRLSLSMRLVHAGLDISTRTYYIASVITGLVCAIGCLLVSAPTYVSALAGFAGAFGIPRWFLSMKARRRQEHFLTDFADAIDVVVRSLKSGLPVVEAFKIIAVEQGPPVGPEFVEVVEGQKVGIPLDQGIARLVERMPLSEVNFLAIVMAIQAKSGGNLSEALGNLSKVLRDRKKMKQKVQTTSMEAKSSAAIMGSVPFILMLALSFMNPDYIAVLFKTHTGNTILIGCGIWMTIGVLTMRKIINFKF